MIKYSEWRNTAYFQEERKAFDQLNKLFHELYNARVKALHENSYQKYAIFHFIQSAERLIETIGAILRRMQSDAIEYQRVTEAEMAKMRVDFAQGKQMVVEADESSSRYQEFLVADFESLYQISGRLLDQWALVVTHLSSMPKARHINFNTLFNDHISNSSNDLCKDLREANYEDIHWIHSHILVFRDNFIVHQNRPYQQNFRVGVDFRMSFFIDPVWSGADMKTELHDEIWKIHDTAPAEIQVDRQVVKNPNFVLGVLFEKFNQLDEQIQSKLIKVAKKNGFTSPSFLMLGTKIFRFVTSTICTARTYAKENYDSVNLGARQG